MEVSESMYRILKNAVKIKIKRGEDGYEVLEQYSGKMSAIQLERMTQELIEEGVLE